MIHLLDETLEALLRAEVPLGRDVDVAFEAPDQEWAGGVMRPTVNLFLHQVTRSTDRQHAGWAATGEGPGGRDRRPAATQLDCRYLVSAWSSEVADQHQLLGSVLATLLDVGLVPDEHLAGDLVGLTPTPVLRAAWPSDAEAHELWSAVGGHLHAGFELVVQLAVDRRLAVPMGPPVVRLRDSVARFGSSGEHRQRVAARNPEPSTRAMWTRRGAGEPVAGEGFAVPGVEGDTVWTAGSNSPTGHVDGDGPPVRFPDDPEDS